MTELIWDGKYKDSKKQGPVRVALPFQTVETVNESAQDRQRNLELFASGHTRSAGAASADIQGLGCVSPPAAKGKTFLTFSLFRS
jgi:hypothetical protein